ncbi:hypothetical protein LLEC1_06527, partial [Akanthomyces lecanii]
MSLVVQRAWRPASTRPQRVATQQRFKTFQRRVDKNNDVYYTIAKRRPVQDPNAPPSSVKFFEMPNLLLDLDAEGIRNVRTFDDKDEELQVARWRVNPKREEVKLKLNDLESKLIETRKRVQDITTNPSNIWRLSSHDLLSAALHGPPSSDSAAPTEASCPDSLEGSHLIDALRRENGIPSHARTSDVLFMEWMLLRRNSTDRAKSKQDASLLDSFQIVEALQSQSSIVGIRRLLRHNLWSFASMKASFGPSSREAGPASDVARAIRRRCIEILDSENARKSQCISCLALIGGLLERLAKDRIEPDHRLQGLALRLSPRSGSYVVLSEWIRRIHVSSSWKDSLEIIEDAAACMQSCSRLLAAQSETAANRQLLLQLLTGLDENEQLAAESLRSIVLNSAREQTSSAMAKHVCDAYAKLLGELGAVRTLLKESEIGSGGLSQSCIDVLKGTPKYSQTLKTQGVKTLSIEDLSYAKVEDDVQKTGASWTRPILAAFPAALCDRPNVNFAPRPWSATAPYPEAISSVFAPAAKQNIKFGNPSPHVETQAVAATMSLPVKRKGAGEEAAGDIAGQPGPAMKRQRTDDTGNATVKRESSDESARSDSRGDVLERTVEREERPISPVARMTKLRDEQGL